MQLPSPKANQLSSSTQRRSCTSFEMFRSLAKSSRHLHKWNEIISRQIARAVAPQWLCEKQDRARTSDRNSGVVRIIRRVEASGIFEKRDCRTRNAVNQVLSVAARLRVVG